MSRESPQQLVQRLIEGYRQTALVGMACQTGLIGELSGKPVSAAEVAIRRDWSPTATQRLLRGLELMGLVTSAAVDGSKQTHYALTAAGEWLVATVPGSQSLYARLSLDQYLPGWSRIAVALIGEITPFEAACGTPIWEYRRNHPEAGELFNAWLFQQSSSVIDRIVAACDVTGVRRVVDLGGGAGALIVALLQSSPQLQGILADQPAVVDQARVELQRLGLADRCETRGIDFFEEVPGDGDLYLLKSVLHDWDDGDCRRILRSVRKAMPQESRLLVIERLLPETPGEDPETVWLDLHMLCVTGGRERTLAEYRDLLAQSGLSLCRVIETGGPFRLLEAGPDGALP